MSKLDGKLAAAKDLFLKKYETFESGLNGSYNAPFNETRKSALNAFSNVGLPSNRLEDWKYTNISPLLKHDYKLSATARNLTADDLSKFLFEGLENNLMVFVNGRFNKSLSNYTVAEAGVVVDNLRHQVDSGSDVVKDHLSRHAGFEEEGFVALNTAFAHDGVFVSVPDNTEVAEPIHVLYISDSADGEFFAAPRNLIVAGKNSKVAVVESYHALRGSDHAYLNNVVTEIVAEENANVEHIKIQDEDRQAYHICRSQSHIKRDSKVTQINIDMGGRLVRNDLNMEMSDQNCEAELIGLYMGTGRQHIDNHTFIDHAMPHCLSTELYKGILGGKAQGVFNGKVMVRQDAQKTNAYQTNQALLLTDDAVINSKPELEIYADDVKCSHGATVGQLDEEALFYLRSRGIPRDKAHSLLQYAFASDVLGYIGLDNVREQLEARVVERFHTL